MNIVQKGLVIIALPLAIEIAFVMGLTHLLGESDRDLAQEAHSKMVMRTAELVGEKLLRSYTSAQRYGWFGEKAVTRDDLRAQFNEIPDLISKLESVVADDPEQSRRARVLRHHATRVVQLISMGLEFGPAHVENPQETMNPNNPMAIKYVTTLDKHAVAALDMLDKVLSAAGKVESQQEATRRLHREFLGGFIGVGVVLNALIAVMLGLYFYRSTTRRLALVFDNTRRLGSSLPLNPPLPGKDEIADLDSSFHTMAVSLQEAMHKQTALIDNARDVICALNQKTEFVDISHACISVFGYPQDELKKKQFLDFIPEPKQEETGNDLQMTVGKTDQPPFETQFTRKDGQVIDILVSALWSELDQSIFCVIHDISEQKAAERLRQEVLQMVTHDLRSPLMSIQAFHTILEAGIAGEINDRGKTLLGSANSSTERMLRLINELLDLEKIKSGKLELTKSETKLQTVFEEAINSVESSAKVSQVTVTTLPTDLCVVADDHRITQVLVNLLANALKFSPNETTITLSAIPIEAPPFSTVPGKWVEVRVSDQGRGIPANMLRSIFNRFEQVERADATQKSGTGLGLSICQALVELHGGEITVESEVGKGSDFIFRLPGLVDQGSKKERLEVRQPTAL